MKNNYTPIIGLEVHVELKTKSKMFCSCSADYFGQKPNTHTCPVCLGLPGALPVPNAKAINWCIKIALALNCKINLVSKFDRKNYFYPDLAKGYQISQYDEPFGEHGSIILSNGKTVRIRRVHMEEDTGKLLHEDIKGEPVSLIDFNRSGVPLVEIVTEPDFDNAKDVKEYLQNLQQIVRYLEVSDADMEKGEMRLEPNISLTNSQLPTAKIGLPPYKVEVKNINSFRFVEKAIEFEIKRQTEILDTGEYPAQETRGWNETKGKTISQRSKEEAHDYRYFPEPDIPPLRFTQGDIKKIRDSIPELPKEKQTRFVEKLGISDYDAEILTRELPLSKYFEEACGFGKKQQITPKQIANTIINKKIDPEKLSIQKLLELIKTTTAVQPLSKSDEKELDALIKNVILENQKAVEDYKNGKESVIMFLLGQVMRKSRKKLQAKDVIEKIKQTLT